MSDTPITDAAEQRCEQAVKLFMKMPASQQAAYLSELVVDITHELLTECRKIERAATVPEAPRIAALEEAAEMCDLAAAHVTLGGALGEYGRGIMRDTAEAIRRLKTVPSPQLRSQEKADG